MNPKILLLLLAAIAAKAQAEAQANPETPCDCPSCTLNRAVSNLLAAREAHRVAVAETIEADKIAEAAAEKRRGAMTAMNKAQDELNIAADAFNKAGRAQA